MAVAAKAVEVIVDEGNVSASTRLVNPSESGQVTKCYEKANLLSYEVAATVRAREEEVDFLDILSAEDANCDGTAFTITDIERNDVFPGGTTLIDDG